MGTRHLIAVQLDNQYRVAQYGQWDGYPSGQGKTVLEFLKSMDRKKFEERLRQSSFLSDDEIEGINKQIKDDRLEEKWQRKWPHLSRDAGADILQMVQDSEAGLKLKDSIAFAADSLFCEFAYVIDLDKNVMEVHGGFNKTPPATGDRFASLPIEQPEHRKGQPIEHYQVRLIKSYPLDALPTQEQMEKDCDGGDEE